MEEMYESSNMETEENFGASDTEAEENGDISGENKSGEWPETWEEKAPEGNEKFSLHHLGITREVDREEALSLAQKGLDYDRIRRERDLMRPRLSQLEELLTALSEESGIESGELLRKTKAAALIRQAEERGESLTDEEAMELVGEISGFNNEEAEEFRRRESILSFSQRFPDIAAEDIPQTVWQDFLAGGELSALYAMEENGRLRRRVAELEQSEKNHFRSTRSRRSAGESPNLSFEELWNSGD